MVKKQSNTLGKVVAVGAGLAAAYLIFGPEGKKNRKTVQSWAVKMKSEIIEQFESAKELTEPVYHDIIDQVTKKYAAFKDIDQKELAAIVKDARAHWKAMSKNVKKVTKTAVKGKAKK